VSWDVMAAREIVSIVRKNIQVAASILLYLKKHYFSAVSYKNISKR